MTTEPPNIDYETLAQDAMRGLVRTVLQQTEKSGLPGDHHFYISFDTNAANVSLSKRLKEKYPAEMTIVLQHRFWDLHVNSDHFEVKLTFDGIPERLVVPFNAIKVFFDPSARYGLQFEEASPQSDGISSLPPEIQQDLASDHVVQSGLQNQISDAAKFSPPASNLSDDEFTFASGRNDAHFTGNHSADSDYDDEPTVIDKEQVASATEGAKIVRLDAFRKKQN